MIIRMPVNQPVPECHVWEVLLNVALSFGNFVEARRIYFGIYEHAWYHWLLSPMGVGSQWCTKRICVFFGVRKPLFGAGSFEQ